MKIHETEIFGPVVVVLQAGDFDEAVRILNEHPYGNGASIYTQSGYWARRFKLEVDCGMIGVNVGIPAPVAQLPFGGMKASQFSTSRPRAARSSISSPNARSSPNATGPADRDCPGGDPRLSSPPVVADVFVLVETGGMAEFRERDLGGAWITRQIRGGDLFVTRSRTP